MPNTSEMGSSAWACTQLQVSAAEAHDSKLHQHTMKLHRPKTVAAQISGKQVQEEVVLWLAPSLRGVRRLWSIQGLPSPCLMAQLKHLTA